MTLKGWKTHLPIFLLTAAMQYTCRFFWKRVTSEELNTYFFFKDQLVIATLQKGVVGAQTRGLLLSYLFGSQYNITFALASILFYWIDLMKWLLL